MPTGQTPSGQSPSNQMPSDPMPAGHRRNRLLPWYIGLGIVLAAVLFLGYSIVSANCPAPITAEIAVLTVVPLVYLILMYLTFVSQR